MWALSQLPLGFHRAAGQFLGWVVRDLVGYRRGVVDGNLAACFPEKSERERERIAHDYYRHLGRVVCEAVWFGSCSRPGRLRRSRIVEAEGESLLNRYYDEGRSVMVLSAHCGNFEIVGGYKTYAERLKCPENNVSMVYKKLSNPVWDKFLRRNRQAPIADKEHYDGMVESAVALRYVLGRKNDRNIFNFITDQYPYGSGNETVSFFGRRTRTMTAAAALAAKLHLPLVYMNMRYRDDGKGYVMSFTGICDDAAEMEPVEAMQKFYDLLEADIRRQPWNYLWSHRRWKNQ